GLDILCISNFTLCARTKKGRRPSFDEAMEPADADKLFNDFVGLLSLSSLKVGKGFFGRHMQIDLEMEGPLNIYLDSKA
ncbi:MAG: D-aminoacyl-tRNA deacylase, partial [Candidatus Omnitrophica bacterium]|nr:D-aminoacyl-tRNA deacylase [Candidatus Omnitrophota bacterium]